ncbi:MAG: NUDIX hydrolase [Actinobacteria bacterium]|nr:NUDIX hydrolase [Actinomycetota bacterium]
MGSPESASPAVYAFCPMCAAALEWRPVGGRPRRACPACGFIHWANPGVGAAAVVQDEQGRVLLVRRAPGATQAGRWSVPAGYVDAGEEIRSAARRELEEETGLVAEIGEVLQVASNFHDPAKPTVGVWFAARVVGGRLRPGDDADAVGYFASPDLPPLAFPTDAALLTVLTAAPPGGEESGAGGESGAGPAPLSAPAGCPPSPGCAGCR